MQDEEEDQKQTKTLLKQKLKEFFEEVFKELTSSETVDPNMILEWFILYATIHATRTGDSHEL